MSSTAHFGFEDKREAEKQRLLALTPLAEDPFPEQKGVLLAEHIKVLDRKTNGVFIDQFKPSSLKPAGYELTIGDEWSLGGNTYKRGDKDVPDFIKIPPFQVVIVQTAERLCMPRFLIGRWNIRVKHVYQGLLWSGAPQVDPGYKGRLFCPIYNLSSKEVILRVGEAFALMDFVKTTSYTPGIKDYDSEPKRILLEDYGELRSALFTEAKEKIDLFETKLKEVESRLATFTTLVFAVLAILISAFGVLFRFKGSEVFREDIIPSYVVAFSLFSLFLSIYLYAGDRFKMNREWWIKGFAIGFLVAVLGGVSIYLIGGIQ